MNWDLSVFYKGFDDPQIERDFARCDEITVEKQAVLKQGLSVRETLEKYMALSEEREQTNKYGEYASLSLSTDANNTAAMQTDGSHHAAGCGGQNGRRGLLSLSGQPERRGV